MIRPTSPVRHRHALELVCEHAAASPDREAAVDGDLRLSYASLFQASKRVAQALAANGAGPGSVVAYFGPPGIHYLVSLLATFDAGATWMGLNPRYRERELGHVIDDAKPRLVLVALTVDDAARHELAKAASTAALTPLVVDLSDGVQGMVDSLEAIAKGAVLPDAAAVEPRERQAAVLVYTSGSSGAPKGARLTHANLMENAWWLAARIDDPGGRILVNLPVNHVGCIADTSMVALMLGSTQVFMRQFDPVEAAKIIRAERISTVGQIPTQFQMMKAAGVLTPEYFSTVKHLAWGGAPMAEPLIRELQGFIPDLFNSYGLTESTGTVTMTEPGASVDQLANSVGVPVMDSAVRLAAEDGSVIDRDVLGVDGEIQVFGDHVFDGYLNNSQATSSSFTSDAWLRTGDVAQWRSDGSLRLVGRLTEMYKSGGYNIYPREVEGVLESHPAIELAAVIGVPDPLWGESGTAYVKTALETLTAEQLAQWCRDRLAAYKVPKRFVLCRDLPLLPIGKVDRSRLRGADARN